MLGVSATGFRERWPLFLGAILTVAIGVALIASAIIVASSASPPQMTGVSPMKASQVRSGFDAVATIMIISAMLTGLLTVFIVATTFAFTVSERRRDLALFRLLGAGRGQVRLMVLGEATLLGCAGAGLGALLTPLAVQLQMMLLRRAHFVPDGFVLNQPWWPVVVAAAIGVGVAILGVVAASGRAAQVPPLEAVGGKPSAARVMTMGRWIGGLTMLAVTAAQIVAASVVGLVVALALAFGVSVTAAIGLTALAPALVPGASSILGLPMRPGVLGTLAGANIRDGVQRSASTAAPVIVLLALVISITGALAAGTRAVTIQQARDIAGDLVVATTGERVDALAHIPGVAATSPEITPPIAVTVHGPGEEGNDPYLSGIVAIDPSGYARLHRGRPVAGSLANLTGDHIAVMQDKIDGINPAIGDPATVRVGPRVIHAVVAAVMPNRLSTDQQILVLDH